MPAAPLRRADLLADQAARPPFGHRRFPPGDPPIRLGVAGSGSGLLLLVWTAADLHAEIEAGVRVLGRLGVRPGMRVANTLPGALATPGALLLGDVNEAIGALDVPLGTADSPAAARAAWDLVDRVECAVLVLAPDTAGALFAAMPAADRPWWTGIVWRWCPGDPQPPAPPAGFAGWERTWLAVPEAASFAAATCAAGAFHLDAAVESAVVEGELILTPRGAAAAPGPYSTTLAVRPADCRCGGAEPAVAPLVRLPPIR